MADKPRRAPVIDFARFRARREQLRLPLSGEPDRGDLKAIESRRPLSQREIEHRARMLRHLGGSGC